FLSLECPEALGLPGQVGRFDAAGLVLDVVADPGDPERAVGPVAGRGEVVLGPPGGQRHGRRDESDDALALERWGRFAGQHFLGRVLALGLLLTGEIELEPRAVANVGQVQNDADGADALDLGNRRLLGRDADRAAGAGLPAGFGELVPRLGPEMVT